MQMAWEVGTDRERTGRGGGGGVRLYQYGHGQESVLHHATSLISCFLVPDGVGVCVICGLP